jgi:hypothetical protein
MLRQTELSPALQAIHNPASLSQQFGKPSIRSDQMVPFGKVLVYGLGSGGSNRVGVLPNLKRHVNQRDHDGQSADDLSEIGEIVESHFFSCREERESSRGKSSLR